VEVLNIQRRMGEIFENIVSVDVDTIVHSR
jgi:hypothetical protein